MLDTKKLRARSERTTWVQLTREEVTELLDRLEAAEQCSSGLNLDRIEEMGDEVEYDYLTQGEIWGE